ncbi:MAG: FtsX-like permease family protein [Silvibacterium sp.]|nr:FtsX-like permease family protein [Silvibacterium sp.]
MSTVTKPALPWSTAARIAWRELRASRAKFVFVLLSVAIGVAALTGVRGFSQAFQKALLGDARGIMAADLSARMFRLATPKEQQQLDALATSGVERTSVTEMVSMASVQGDPVPLLVSLKAVDPAVYPYYGHIVLSPAGSIHDLLTDSTALVDDNLLVRLNAKVGDTLKIGTRHFRIAAVILREPDRMTAGVGLGPRVMITRRALLESGLLGLGSRASERYLFKINGSQESIATLRPELEKILPDAQVMDFRETSPELTRGLDNATGLLSLICLVAMVLGAIGVAMAMRAHLQQRIEILAIMKSIGARSSDILRIYLLQTIFLGLAGGLLGVVLGLGVEYVFPSLLGSLLPLRPPLALAIKPVSAALATGILTTILFCLPPLLDVRHVRPIAVLRKMVETAEGVSLLRRGENPRVFRIQRILLAFVLVIGLASLALWIIGLRTHTLRWSLGVLILDVAFGITVVTYGYWGPKFRERKLQWFAIALIVAGLAAIAAALSDSWTIGKWFAASLCAVLLVILGLSALTLRTLRAFLDKTRLHLPSAVRHGLANLYRPGNQSSAVLAALGAGVMLILAVYLMQSAIVREMHNEVSSDTPNVFLVDIAPEELAGVQSLLAKQPGVQSQLETIPIISSRITSIDGVPVDQLKFQNYPRRMLRSAAISWSEGIPKGTKISQGQWWKKPDDPGLAVVDRIARRLNLHLGSKVDFSVDDRTVSTVVTAIYKVDGEHAFARSEYILAPGLVRDLPATWYGAIHVAPSNIPQLERTLFAAYPTITVINLADILQTIQDVAGHIILVIRFLAGFSILSGAIILASSVASTRFRRIREVVVLKTLGGTRNRIAQVFSIEFLVLGLLSGAVGVLFANLLARILLRRMDIHWHADWFASGFTVIATAVLAIATGWIASFRILGQKPLEVLREE